MSVIAEPETVPSSEPFSDPEPVADGWRPDKKGRLYVPARGRSGTVYREGNETVEEAYARDAQGPRQRGPKPKAAPRPAKAAAPRAVSLQEIERNLAGMLTMPSGFAAMQGDKWAAEHIDRVGPILARNLCKAAETNVWLRDKLEGMMSGGDMILFKILALMPVIQAGVAYVVPLIVYYFDPRFIPSGTREAFQVPIRPGGEDRAKRAAIARREYEAMLATEQASIDAILRQMETADAGSAQAAEADEPAAAEAA